MSTELSEYELVRLENIKRNEEFLKSMGLYKDPNAPPTGVDAFRPAKRKTTRKSVLKAVKDEELEPVRRSSRNASSLGIKEEHVSLSNVENEQTQPKAKRRYDPQSAAATYFDKKSGDEEESGEYSDDDDEEDGKRKREVVTPAELRAFIDNVCPEHSEMISNGAIQLCAYRCAYMTIAALKNRVRAVSTGGGKKSHEKLLVVTYAMKAMGLHRLAETAAALLKRNTGLVAVLGDGSSGSSRSIGSGAAVSKVEDGGVDVKNEVIAEMDVKIEADCEAIVVIYAGASGSSASSSVVANSSVVVKTEPGTPNVDATDTTNTGPGSTGRRTRGSSTPTSIVRTDDAATTAYSGDGGECMGNGSRGNVKLEPGRGPRASTSGRNSRRRSIVENNEPSSVKKKRQKIEETRDGKMQD